jgi:hypothetical protein
MGHKKERKTEREPDPILKLRHARLKAMKVMEKEAHKTDEKVYAPKVSIWWEILDDKSGGEHNGVRFWDNYSFVKSFEDEKNYVIREGTRIGDLAAFVAYEFEDGADYFESDVDIVFEDLEGAQVIASLEPRKFKEGEPATGTRTVSSTLMMAEAAEKVASGLRQKQEEVAAAKEAHNARVDDGYDEPDEEEDFDDIPW